MTAMQESYDSAFLGILQHEGDIGNFLNCVFGFLFRKTDFFVTLKSKNDRMGFPPGVAHRLTMAGFKKYEALAQRAQELRERSEKAREEKQKEKEALAAAAPPMLQEVEVTSTGESPTSDAPQTQTEASAANQPISQQTNNDPQPVVGTSSSGQPLQGGKEHQGTESSVATPKSLATDPTKIPPGTDADDDPVLTRQQQMFQANATSYNGAIRDNYAWSQSITDVDVHVQIPKKIRKAKDVKVAIERKHLKAAYKCDSGEWKTVVDGNLTWEVNLVESMWSLVPGEHIHVNLEKVQERWWEAVLDKEEKISVRKIDPSRPMTDLEDEAQAKIEEMMYNQRQKQMGLPQSHEQKVQGMLRQAWDAEGSPFKGQPFDPSKLNMSGDNMVDINS